MKPKALLVVIITCWCLLITALIIKLPFNHYFEIKVNNQTLINAGAYIDQRVWLKLLIVSVFYIFSNYLIYLALSKQKIGRDWWVLLICIPIPTIKYYVSWLGFALDMCVLFLLPLIKRKFKNWLTVLIGIVIIMGYQLIVMFIRNLGLYLSSENILIGLIMNIDYYIMIVLLYLHLCYTNIRKEKVEE